MYCGIATANQALGYESDMPDKRMRIVRASDWAQGLI